MKKIRIAQIGINRYSHGGEIFNTLKKMSDVFDIVGYALVENERETCVDKLSIFDGYKELALDEILNDDTIEAVTVETDEIHLLKYALLAALLSPLQVKRQSASQILQTELRSPRLSKFGNKTVLRCKTTKQAPPSM